MTTARPNEREFFPFTGVSYVVVKVAEGFSPHEDEDKVDLVEEQRARLLKLLQKYSG